jgi:tetratricopeptide (TPR) repeat protein
VSRSAIFWASSIVISTIIPLIPSISIAASSPEIDRFTRSSSQDLAVNITQTNKAKSEQYLALAVQNYRQGNFQDAVVDLNRAVKVKPDYAIAYDLRGLIKYQNLRDFPGALADFDRALSLDPQLVSSCYNRGLLKYRNLNDKPGGIADMQAAAKLFQARGDRESAQDAANFLKKWGVVGGI